MMQDMSEYLLRAKRLTFDTSFKRVHNWEEFEMDTWHDSAKQCMFILCQIYYSQIKFCQQLLFVVPLLRRSRQMLTWSSLNIYLQSQLPIQDCLSDFDIYTGTVSKLLWQMSTRVKTWVSRHSLELVNLACMKI